MHNNSNFNFNYVVPCVRPEDERRNGIIYKIFHNENENMFYIGSTFTMLRDRIKAHITNSKTHNNKLIVNNFNRKS